MTHTAPSILEQQTAADWIRSLVKDNLVGACVNVDEQHLHVDIKVITHETVEPYSTRQSRKGTGRTYEYDLASWEASGKVGAPPQVT